MMNFDPLFSPDAKLRVDSLKQEIERLYRLPDRWLAREMLMLARQVREIGHRDFGSEGQTDGAQSVLFWDVIPEISKRLGETSFHEGERSPFIQSLSNDNLRIFAGCQIYSQPMKIDFAKNLIRGFNVYHLMTNHPNYGNPVMFSLDRFAPANRNNPDVTAMQINRMYASMGADDVYEWDLDLLEEFKPTLRRPRSEVKSMGMF